MAEATTFRNNATRYPVYGLPWVVTFPILDADGDLVTGATGLDSEVGLNGDTLADCTNEATEMATTSGTYYLALTAAEMTADIVTVIVKTSSSGAKTTTLTIYPQKLPLLLLSDNAGAYDSTTTINLGSGAAATDDFYNGCIVYVYGGTGSGQVRLVTDYVGSTKLATVHVAWATNPDTTSDLKIYRTELAPHVSGANVTHWNGLATVALPLCPTTAGRTLDVSATGEAGLDFANINAATGPTTLTNITVPTVTTVTTTTNLTNERGKYANGSVWIGPLANTNTTPYTDGIVTNPVSTVAAAKSIADAATVNMRRFEVIRTAAADIGASMVGYRFTGVGWTLSVSGGARDVGTSAFLGAQVSNSGGGTFASTSGTINWENCEFATGVTVGVSNMIRCYFQGTLTLSTAGNYDFIDCASVVAGTSTPVFAVPAGTVNISFRRWSGGISITGITSGTTISIDMVSGGSVTLAGADGNVQIRGMTAGITDNRTGTPTLGQNAALNRTVLATPTNITAAAGCAVSSIGNDVITAAAIANGAIDAATFAAGAIDAAAIATGAIDADAIAADAIGSSELAATAADEIADAILARNIAGGSSTGRTVKQALYLLRNKWAISGGTLTVYETDDTTSSWTATLTAPGGTNAITVSDPA